MISVDTSVLVRYLVGTPAAPARRAAALLDDDGTEIGISPVALAECAHVLRTQYGVTSPDIIEALISLVQRDNVRLLGIRTEPVVEALVRARSMPGRPIPDALIVAASVATNALPLVTFDRQQSSHGIDTREP